MGKRSYHGAMINVQPKYPNGRVRMDCSTEYKEGHCDARYECADIANDADAEIAALKAENERLRAWIKASYKDLPIYAWDGARALLGEGGEG